MHLRDARTTDLPALLDLTIEAFRPLFERALPAQLDPTVLAHDHGRWEDDYRVEIAALLDPEHGRFVTLAEEDGRVLGYVGWQVEGASGRLQMVAVHPDAHRRGVGAALCSAVVERLRDHRVAVAHVGTGGDEFHAPARGLYESLGFRGFPVVDYSVSLSAMTATAARDLYRLLDEAAVRCWVMGGWGVDALLGRASRAHHDLDLLVLRDDLPIYEEVVRGAGFRRSHVWKESRRIRAGGHERDSAFVDEHPDGRQIDVHVIDVGPGDELIQLHDGPWPVPAGALSGRGVIAGGEVRCVTQAAQLAMHTGYDLTDVQRADVPLLATLPD